MLEVICVPQYISYFYTPFYSVNAPNWQTTHSITRHYAGLYFNNNVFKLSKNIDMFCGTDGVRTRNRAP